jgi:hypothetical protein
MMSALKRLLLICLTLLPGLVFATPASDDNKVDVGIYINRVDSLSYVKGNYMVDMTLWFRWQNPNLHPNKTFTIKGATINNRRDEYDGLMGQSDMHWAGVDIVATVPNKFDIEKFPFDAQKLLIQIEEMEQSTQAVNYRLDQTHMRLNPRLEIPGWRVDGDNAFMTFNEYPTNFGYSDGKNDDAFVSSQLNYELLLSRISMMSGLKLIFAPVVAILILFFTSLLPTTQSARFGVGTTAIFALVSSHYLILTQLPESNHITIAEQIVLFGLLQSLIYFMVTVYSFNLQDKGKMMAHQKADRYLAISLGTADLIFALYIVSSVLR